MTFNYYISPIIMALLGSCVFLALVFCVYYCIPLLKVHRWRKHCNEEASPLDPDAAAASASVIVYSRDELPGLERVIPRLLAQDYEGDYEIIVVNEGESAQVREYIDSLQLAHRNLYLTHTPDGARSLSRKKLALTLGVKAARGEVVVFTTASAIINSDRWLAEMLRPFNTDAATELVTGVALPLEGEDTDRGRRRRSFDFVADCVTWITSALRHRPYRGMEQNLAYRRDLFFKNKGFSRSLNIQHGDDDIFINEIATADNTVLQLSDESLVFFDADIFRFTYPEDAIKRAFTGRHIRHGARRRMALGSWILWIWLAVSATALVLDFHNWLTIGTVAFSGLAIITMLMISWRSAMKALKGRKLLFTLPGLLATRPFRKIYYSIRSRRGRHFTYS